MFSQFLVYQLSNLLGKLPPGSVFLDLLFSRAPPLLFSGPGVLPEVAIGYLKPTVKWMAVLVGNSGQWCHGGFLVSIRTLCPEQRGAVALSTCWKLVPFWHLL